MSPAYHPLSAIRHLPLANPQPDARRLIAILRGEQKSDKVPLIEYIVDDTVMAPVLTDLLGRTWVPLGPDPAQREIYLRNVIEFWYRLGYDVVRLERAFPFPPNTRLAQSTVGQPRRRAWAEEHEGLIRTWADLDRYPWPRPEDMDYSDLEFVNRYLPEGMGLVASHAGGPFEQLSWIMSYEGLCYGLYDAPGLVQAVLNRLGELLTCFYRHLLSLDRLVAVFPGDDLGFRTGTLISPAHLREYVLPLHARFARMAHERGLCYFLHSCGNLKAVLEDLIAQVQIDGKHSFEDAIQPVEQFQATYGQRIAVLGGLDVHKLATMSSDDVRLETRRLIETCGPTGRFAIGSGNSIPDYVPVENYLAMVDEANRL